ncbi:MAG: armadillo-type protein [Benniella sp.]|nr:MAG: armadillo-type protein [Benniella sp.]
MARVSSVPASRPEVIQSLIDGVDRYNPDNVTILEEYLATQCTNKECDTMANLAILKLYQFNNHLINDQVVNNILVKALTTLPEPDFNLCLYLLSDQMANEEPVVRLIALQDLLEQARYTDFWKVYESDDIYKELTAEVLGFEDAIRANIANAVAMTFQSIELQSLQAYVHLKGQALSDFIQAQGWTETNGVVSIPVNKDNEAKTVVLAENIRFEQLIRVIGHSNDA